MCFLCLSFQFLIGSGYFVGIGNLVVLVVVVFYEGDVFVFDGVCYYGNGFFFGCVWVFYDFDQGCYVVVIDFYCVLVEGVLFVYQWI